MVDYRVLQADFRETLAACEGQAALIAMSPPYPDARTCYESLTWEDYQALGDASKDALLPGGHCLLNLSAPVRQLRKPALSDLLKKEADLLAKLTERPLRSREETAAEETELEAVRALIPTAHGTERDPMPWRLALDWIDRVELSMPDDLIFGRRGTPGKYRGRFRRDHEPLFWFRKPGIPRGFHDDRLKSAAVEGAVFRRFSVRGRDGTTKRSDTQLDGSAARGTLWGYGGVGQGAACDGDRRFIGGDLAEEWARKSQELADRRYSQMALAL